MKTLPKFAKIAVFLSVMLHASAQAFATTIELSADDFDYFCKASDAPGIVTVFVRTSFNLGTRATRFRIQAGPGVTWTYLSETPLLGTFQGNTQTGIAICYEQCLVGQSALMSVQYMAYGTSEICVAELLITPHPDAQTVEVINCDGSPSVAVTRSLVVGGICACPSSRTYPGTPQPFDCVPTPVRPTTWGTIKALYRS